MDLVGDRRAQSVQIGAVLLFAVLVIAFSSYQAFVVPNQNREVEFNHNQEVQSQLQDLRNALVSVSSTGDRSVSVRLGAQYPSRAIARNPGRPSGSLRTVGTTDESVALTIANAQTAGETGDFWNQTQSYNTGGIAYQPQYNAYTGAPETVYDNTILYNSFRTGTVTVANQSFIDGTDISLTVLNGSLSRSSAGSTAVDVRPVSASSRTVRLDNQTGSNVTITFASQRPASHWDFLETTQSTVIDVTSVDGTGEFYDVTVELAGDRTYDLRMTEVGVGTRITDEAAAYLTDIDGDGRTVEQGETTELTLEVRDRLNNPPANASETTVNASVAGSGSLDSTSATPDADGHVTFEYTAPSGATGAQDIRFSYQTLASGFDASTPQDVSMTVDVQSSGGGGGGAYAVDWIRPPFARGILSESLATQANLRTTPVLVRTTDGSAPVSFVDVDYGTNGASVVRTNERSGETNVTGYNATSAAWQSDGYATLYASSGGTGDTAAYTYDRLLNESFEDDELALVSNGWYYNASNPNGDAGVTDTTDSTGSPAGDNRAFIEGDAGTGDRAIELNYSLDTSDYDALTLTYVVRQPDAVDDADPPGSGAGNWNPGENLYVQYRASDDSWVAVDNVSSVSGSGPITRPRRTLIQGVDNASHANFAIRFVQRETTAQDRWELDAIDVIGLDETELTGLNQAPVPAFRYSTSGTTVTVDANRSDDPDDSDITAYDWDWTSDGTFDDSGETTSHDYGASTTETVTLRATDARGATATTSQTVTVGGGGGGTGGVTYNNDGRAFDDDGSPNTREGTLFSVTNAYSSSVTVTSVTLDPQNNSIDFIDDGGRQGQQIADNDTELSIRTASQPGYKDISAGASIPDGGLTIDLSGSNSQQAQIAAGDTADVYFYRFLTADGGSYVDMTCEDIDVTVSFASQPDETYTVTAGPPSGNCVGFNSVDATDVLPSTTSQTQTLTFVPATNIPSGQDVNVTLSDGQASGQLVYTGNFRSPDGNIQDSNVGAAGAYVVWSASGEVTAGTPIEVEADLRTQDRNTGSDPYDVTFERVSTADESTATHVVSQSAGDAQISNLAVSDVTANTVSQTQTVNFTLDSQLGGGETVAISLRDPENSGDLNYRNSSASKNFTNGAVSFVTQNQDNATIQLTAPSGGLSGGVSVEITSVYTEDLPNAPYEVGISREDADTASATFGAGTVVQLPTLSTRVDDLSDDATDGVRLIGSYNVSNTNSSFQRVDITYTGPGGQPFQRTNTRAGAEFTNGFGTENSYDITYDVVYNINGGERVMTSQTVTDTPDGSNPSGNADISGSGSAQISTATIQDRSSNSAGPRYRFDYDVGTGSFSEVALGVLSINNNNGATEVVAGLTRSDDRVVDPGGGGLNTEYRSVIVVRDANGAVVDTRELVDTADGTTAGNNRAPIQTQVNNFGRNPGQDEFTVQAQGQDNGDQNMDRLEYVIFDSTGTVVATATRTGSGQQIQPGTITISSSNVQGGETYTVIVTGYDNDGNYDWASLSG